MLKNNKEENIISAIDIGSSKIIVLIAEMHTINNHFNIIGIGNQVSNGLRQGSIINIEATAQCIKLALNQAEKMSGKIVNNTYVTFSGIVDLYHSQSIVAIENSEVSKQDLQKLFKLAEAFPIPTHQKILHNICPDFLVNNHNIVKDPLGITAVRLETVSNLITASKDELNNIYKVIYRCGINLNNIIYDQLASSFAILTDDDKNLGTCLIDIGSSNTKIMIFLSGKIVHISVIPIAGIQITNDIAQVLGISKACAEYIKINFGSVINDLINIEELNKVIKNFQINQNISQNLSNNILTSIIQARIKEIFKLIIKSLINNQYFKKCRSGIILTGGSSKIDGILHLSKKIFKIPIKIGQSNKNYNNHLELNDPSYASCLGLLIYIQQEVIKNDKNTLYNLKNIMCKMKKWLNNIVKK